MSTISMLRMQDRLNQLWGPRSRLPGDVMYLLPGDQCEWERLYFEHYAFKVACGRTFFAPLIQPRSILDAGCGPGCWAIDMCRAFPRSRVVGFDINATSMLHRPDNYSFVQGSLLEPLPFADNSFDYVHQRLMWAAIPTWSWRSVLTELVRVTTPGGYLELFEIAPGLETMGPATARLVGWVSETKQRCGVNPAFVLDLPNLLELAGTTIHLQRILWLPAGAVQGHKGRLIEQSASAFFASFFSITHECLALSLEEYQYAWNMMREEWTRRSIRCPFALIVAQKTARQSSPLQLLS